MSRVVKPPATTPVQARTRLARTAVVDAARTLFVQRGYAATTVEAISKASGVPQATIYRLFTSKIGILKTLLDVAAVGDDRPIPFGERPDIQAALAIRDPYELLDFFARLTPDFMARVAPVQHILIGAAATDSEAADLLIEHTRQRQRGQARIAAALARLGALPDDVSERTAADIIHALMSPDLYRLLTIDRGWTANKYATWLARTLSDQLIEPAGAGVSHGAKTRS